MTLKMERFIVFYDIFINMNILDQSFYARDTISVARNLLGKHLISTIHGELVSGIIVETEAYRYRDDKASHAYCGKKRRNCAMFGAVGHAYIYFIYGSHFCFNVVARDANFEAVRF
jgi:DNA-3-methyladenine glycosylase